MKPLTPKKFNLEGIPVSYSESNSRFEFFSESPRTDCWKCADSPCIKIESLISQETMKIKGSNLLDLNICPTKSISQNPAGEIVIDESTCTGCGLCVLNCPVNALTISNKSIPHSSYSSLRELGNKFIETRTEKAEKLHRSFERITPELIGAAIKACSRLLEVDNDGKGIQLFVRNVFTQAGFKTRIRIEGDTNDAFELVAESKQAQYPIEIAIGGDTLDSTRRILSGCARLVSKGIVEVPDLKPILIVDQLPNSRSEIYRVIEDMNKYLHLDLKIIPLSILQIIVFSGISLEDYFVKPDESAASEWFWRSLMEIGDAKEGNLEILKLSK